MLLFERYLSEYLYTFKNNEAIFIYVRFVRNDQLVKEMLFTTKLITDTAGKSIFGGSDCEWCVN